MKPTLPWSLLHLFCLWPWWNKSFCNIRHSEVCIFQIPKHNVYITQSCNHECKSNAIMQPNMQVYYQGHLYDSMMTSSNKTRLSHQVHVDIKHDMTPNFLETNKVRNFSFLHLLQGVTVMWPPCHLDLHHFFIDGLPSKVSVHNPFNSQTQSFFHFWY